LSLQKAEMFVELPPLDTDEGVNFASEVEFFYPGTCGSSQVPYNPTLWLLNNTSSYQSSHSYFLLLLLHLGCTTNHRSIPFVYLMLV